MKHRVMFLFAGILLTLLAFSALAHANPIDFNPINAQCLPADGNSFTLNNYLIKAPSVNSIEFSLDRNSANSDISCSLAGGVISCAPNTNKYSSLLLDVNARITDTNSQDYNYIASTQFSVKSNCFDNNGDTGTIPLGTGLIAFSSDTKNVSLSGCTTQSVPATITNSTNARKCFSFDTEVTPYAGISASVSDSAVCLNKNESASVSLQLNSCNAEQRNYIVKLYEIDSNIALKFNVSALPSGNYNTQGFTLVDFSGQVCRGESTKTTVLVRNTSSGTKRVMLSAENSLVLPYFDKKFLDLAGGQQKDAQLVINARNLDLGTYRIVLSGTADQYNINKEVFVEVVDCSSIHERTFRISVPATCFDAPRGGKIESQFSVISQVDPAPVHIAQKNTFYLSTGGMPSELAQNSVTLSPNESKSVAFTAIVPASAPSGKNYVTIYGADSTTRDAFTDEAKFCINVLGQSKAYLVVHTQSLDIQKGSSRQFELEVVNNGDFDANFSPSVIEVPTGVNVNFPSGILTVPKGSSRTFFVTVSASQSAVAGEDERAKILLRGSLDLSAYLYFNITERTVLTDLQIVSAPTKIALDKNSSADFTLVIKNNTLSAMSDVVVSVIGLSGGLHADTLTIGQIQPGSTATVTGKIYSGNQDGNFVLQFAASSQNSYARKNFSLLVGSGGSASFAGLFGLLNGVTLGGVLSSALLALVIILLVTAGVYATGALTDSSKKREDEPWRMDYSE